MENVADLWGLWRTSGPIAEEEQNKLDKCPSQMMKAKIWANGGSKVDYASQWTLDGSLHPWISKINMKIRNSVKVYLYICKVSIISLNIGVS